ncbi:MAG: hypothetical protein U9R24_00120 [Thermodesulfobacteriota bacterium]|nr:hypothetical protein [Thermodesulfobacteriota bacterium]
MRIHSRIINRKTLFVRISLLVCLSVFISGCASNRDVVTKSFYRQGDLNINKIGIIPFQKVVSEDPSRKFMKCPLCGTVLRTCELKNSPEITVEELFTNELRSRGRYIIMSSERTRGIYTRISSSSFKALPQEVFKEVGRELGIDGIIAGYVFCYRERKGYPWSVERPASVVFSVHLIRVDDGALVWRGTFDKTQSSLMEDLLNIGSFIRQGGKWVTARKLSEEGVEGILETFPGLD